MGKKISQLPAVGVFDGTELLEVDQAGVSSKATADEIAAFSRPDPSTLSRIVAYTPPITGIASGDYLEDAITGGSSWLGNAEVVGTDLSFTAGYEATIDVNVDGVYAVTFEATPYSPTAGSLTEADFILPTNSNAGPVEHYAGPLGGVTNVAATLNWTGFIAAATGAIAPSLRCLTSAGTWGVGGARIVIQRIA